MTCGNASGWRSGQEVDRREQCCHRSQDDRYGPVGPVGLVLVQLHGLALVHLLHHLLEAVQLLEHGALVLTAAADGLAQSLPDAAGRGVGEVEWPTCVSGLLYGLCKREGQVDVHQLLDLSVRHRHEVVAGERNHPPDWPCHAPSSAIRIHTSIHT